MKVEDARIAAQLQHRNEVHRILDNPETEGWPIQEYRRLVDGSDGVKSTTLANALGCTKDTIAPHLGESVGRALGHFNRMQLLYDSDLLFHLADHPEVLASRKRRLLSLKDQDRKSALEAFFSNASDFEFYEFNISEFRSIDHISVKSSQLNILFGKNGAGKTSILDALHRGLRIRDRGNNDVADVSLAVTFQTNRSHDEAMIAASYLALGSNAAIRDDLEILIRALLEKPAACSASPYRPDYGANYNRWTVAWRPSEATLHRESARNLSRKKVQGRYLKNIIAAIVATEESPCPIYGITVPVSSIEIVTLDSDAATLERRIFDRVANCATSLLNALLEPHWETDEDAAEETAASQEGQDFIVNVTDQSDVAKADLKFLDKDGNLCGISAAAALKVTWGALELDLPTIQLDDFSGLHECYEALLRGRVALQGDHPESDIPLHTACEDLLIHLSRATLPHSRSPWSEMSVAPRRVAFALLALIEQFANEHSPFFFRVEGRIILIPREDDFENGGDVGILDDQGIFRSLNELPSGIESWVGLLVELAANEILESAQDFHDNFRHLRFTEDSPVTADTARTLGAWSLLEPMGTALKGSIFNAIDITLEPVLPRIHRAVDEYISVLKRHCRTSPGNALTLFLVDEPELHLHPSAQDDIVEWCIQVASRWTVLVATHAPSFLRLAPSEGQILKVARNPGEWTRVEPLGGPVLETIDELAETLGLGRDRLLQLVRGLVIMEGITDCRVLKALAGDMLDKQRLELFPLHGHTQTKAFGIGELAATIGLPIAIIFDEITDSEIKVLQISPNADVSDEAKSAWRLMQIQRKHLDSTIIPFDGPDICAALPEAAVRALYPKFSSWEEVSNKRALDMSQSFKNVFLNQIGVSKKLDSETIIAIANSWNGHDELPQAFKNTISGLEAWADNLGVRHASRIDRPI